MNTVFYLTAAVAVISTGFVVTRSNAVHALLYLIVSLLSMAVIFYVMGAPFVAAMEVILYAGAIMVLFVFVIMMLNLGPQTAARERRWMGPGVWVGPGILTVVLLAEFLYIQLHGGGAPQAVYRDVGPRDVGTALFGPYLLGVELASFLLLAGLVGAYHLGRRRAPAVEGGEES